MRILFYSPHLSLGGTEITMYDFADYNEKILGNESVITYNDIDPFNHDSAINKFCKRFRNIHVITGHGNTRMNPNITNPQLDKIISKEACDAFYTQKFGYNDGVGTQDAKNLILCAAPVCEPHGDVYAYVSEWLSEKASGGKYPSVPSMITPLEETTDTFRTELGIPKDAMVFGRIGGDTWNIPWANDVLRDVTESHPEIYFLFQNTKIPFTHSNIKHIPPTACLETKAKFISTCNAMLHCRNEGESFGCACGEFSNMNRRVITYGNSKDRNHIELLGDKGIYYHNDTELYRAIINFKYEPNKDWRSYMNYGPERIMSVFNKVFLGK